jgi:hypothetical protein
MLACRDRMGKCSQKIGIRPLGIALILGEILKQPQEMLLCSKNFSERKLWGR